MSALEEVVADDGMPLHYGAPSAEKIPATLPDKSLPALACQYPGTARAAIEFTPLSLYTYCSSSDTNHCAAHSNHYHAHPYQLLPHHHTNHCSSQPRTAAECRVCTAWPGDIITLKETHHQGFMLADGFNNPELIFAKMPTADIRASCALPARSLLRVASRSRTGRCCISQAASGKSCGSSTTSTRRSCRKP